MHLGSHFLSKVPISLQVPNPTLPCLAHDSRMEKVYEYDDDGGKAHTPRAAAVTLNKPKPSQYKPKQKVLMTYCTGCAEWCTWDAATRLFVCCWDKTMEWLVVEATITIAFPVPLPPPEKSSKRG